MQEPLVQLAFVVMSIAYVQNPILSTEAFYVLMFMTFRLNIAVPVSLTLWKPYYVRAMSAPDQAYISKIVT
jgi:hypothetical protein